MPLIRLSKCQRLSVQKGLDYDIMTDERILEVLSTASSIRSASKQLGISDRTIYRRMKDPDFMERYQEQRKTAIDTASQELVNLAEMAIETIKKVMQDENASPQIRLNASGLILGNILKYHEMVTISAELDAIKERLKTIENANNKTNH